jgi:Family of unknown function (DUF6328)
MTNPSEGVAAGGPDPARASAGPATAVADTKLADRHEAAARQADRDYGELLRELRVFSAASSVLFAFLLGCAFTTRFDTLDAYQRGLFVMALLLTLISVSLITAPVVHHRFLHLRRRRFKPRMVTVASRSAIIALMVLMGATSSTLLLVLDFVAGHLLGAVLSCVMVAWFATWWYAVPMATRLKLGHRRTTPPRPPSGARSCADSSATSWPSGSGR